MDREALRKAQQASRNAYLRKEAQRQERAAAAVLQARLKEVEQGVVPSTVTEAELLLQRSREVRVAGGLLQAAQQRQALAGESVPPMAEGDSAEMTTMAREEQAARLLVVQHMPLPSGHPRQQDEDDDGAHGHDAVGERAEGEGVALCGRTTGRVHRDTTEERAHTARCMATEMPPPSLSAPAVEAAASIAVAATLAAPPTRLSEVDAFVPMSSGEVERRLGDGDYVLEKTMEERQQERVDALQSQHDRLRAQRRGLPIYQIRNELVSLITENQVVIVVGETGSGKTTQILQYLYEEGFHLRRSRDNSTVDSKARNSHARLHSCSAAVMTTSRKGAQDGNCPSREDSEGDDDDLNNRDNNTAHRHDTSAQEREDDGGVAEMRLLCTQPRRLAAIGVADRVAKEMNCRCGSVVGYRVRFDDKSGPLTRILFLTDGMMLKEFANDPDMRQVAAIMIDEAHERSIDTDILLGLLRDVTRRNRDLRIIVASATINASRFSDFFDHAPVFAVSGRTFPVDTFYSDAAVVDYVAESAATAMALHVSKPLPGDVLIFLPGQDSIELCAEALRKAMEEGTATGDSHTGGSSWQVGASIRPLWILPVYASLAPQEQARIYEPTPPGTRKVVLATNIAETSITIDGVVYVIDCGLCKQNFYNARAMVEELRVVPTSQASATQRAGRAGRTQHGECYRLYTPYTFLNELPVESVPEVRRGSMSAVVLQLKSLGIDNLLQFDFLDPPATESLERALDHLYLLGAMSGTGELTRTGRRMAHFPLEPSMSKSVIRGCALGCGRHAAMAAAMLSLESIFVHSREARVQQQLSSAKVRLLDCRQAGDVVGYVHIMESWLRASSAGVGGGAEFCRTHCIHPRSMRRAQDVLDQMLRTCERVGLSWRARRGEKPPGYEDEDTDRMDGNDIAVNIESLTKSLLSGFFFNVATLEADKRTYRIVRPMDMASGEGGTLDSGRSRHALADAEYDPTAEIHPTSILFRYGAAHGGGGGGERQGTGGATKLGGGGQEGQAALSARERPFLVVFTQLRRTTKRFMMHLTIVPCAEWVLASAPVNYFRKEELESGLRKRLRA